MKNKNKNTKLFLFLFLLPLLVGVFGFSINTSASENKIVINEIMADPEGTDGDSEWVELYNAGEDSVDLSDWDLDPDAGSYISLEGKVLDKKAFLLVKGISKMRNDKGQVSLYKSRTHTSESMVDYVQYGSADLGTTENKIRDRAIEAGLWQSEKYVTQALEGNSLELIKDGGDNDSPEDWQESYVLGGTPGKENSKKPETKIYSDKIRINEFLPAPSSGNEEFTEFYNPTEEQIELSGWKLTDASASGKYIFPEGTFLEPAEFLVVYKNTFKFALNNSGAESIDLFDPNGKLVSAVSYSGSKTDVSYNFDGENWKQSRFLTPGQKNKFNSPPKAKGKKAKKIYANMYADFSAEGYDADRDKLKFVWDFGDGHKSYLKKTRHKFAKSGKYKVTLKVSDGSEDVFQNFNIEVKKFPKSKITIMSVLPNPKGKDSDLEWVVP